MYSVFVTRRSRRLVLTAVVLPLVVLIGFRSAWASYVCSVTGEVLAACCCPNKADRDRVPVDSAPLIEASCCCDVTAAELSLATDVRESERSRAVDAPWIPVDAVFAHATVPQGTMPLTRVALARPPPRTVPTYLTNRTLLR